MGQGVDIVLECFSGGGVGLGEYCVALGGVWVVWVVVCGGV